jgi:hypothetical protein
MFAIVILFYTDLERSKAPFHVVVLSGRLKAIMPFYTDLERSKAPFHVVVLRLGI